MRFLLASLSLLSSTFAVSIDLNVLIVNGIKSQDYRSVTEQEETEPIQANDEDTSEKTCLGILYSASSGLSPSFPGVIAHGIHSLSAPDVRRFFPSSTKMPYNIPVVNPDLSSSEPILFSPPDFDHTFNSQSLQLMDSVLTHMDNPNYDMRLYTPLERIVHGAHMQEVWQEAGKVFNRMKVGAGGNIPAEVCKCMKNIESNGILKMLRLIALKVREPGLMYGQHVVMNNGTMDWSGNLYTYHFVDTDDQVLADHLKPLPHLRTGADWAVWKSQMASMKKDMGEYSLANYMSCVLDN